MCTDETTLTATIAHDVLEISVRTGLCWVPLLVRCSTARGHMMLRAYRVRALLGRFFLRKTAEFICVHQSTTTLKRNKSILLNLTPLTGGGLLPMRLNQSDWFCVGRIAVKCMGHRTQYSGHCLEGWPHIFPGIAREQRKGAWQFNSHPPPSY